jgi:hypothetical protein
MQSWVQQVNTNVFKQCYDKIVIDFAGNKNREEVVEEFKELLVQEAEFF